MSEFEKGDRVEVKFEATVEKPLDESGDVFFSSESMGSGYIAALYLTKLHDPLPTKDGAVIRIVTEEGHNLVFELCDRGGAWYQTGEKSLSGQVAVEELANEHGFTVLYAGDDV